MENKTGIVRLLAKIGQFFEGLFNAASKTYDKQSPEIKQALKNGSDILNIINSNISEAPEFVIELIQKTYPSIDRETLLKGLKEVSKGINQTDAMLADTLEETILNIQKYLSGLDGKFWPGVIELSAKILAIFFAPAGTKWVVISSLMEYVYRTFIKK